MRLATKLIIGITLSIILICAGYSATIINTTLEREHSLQIGVIDYKGQFLMPVENFNVVTSKYGARIHPISRKTKLSYRY